MSQENVERLRAYCESWEKSVVPDFDLLLDPEIVFEDDILPDHAGETYRGHEGVARATRTWLQPYEEVTIELEEIVGSGERLVSTHRFRARARHTGITAELRYAYVWTFRDGKVIHLRSFRDAAQALEAAGLRE
jgi:ketosteroid isomerase-like protein